MLTVDSSTPVPPFEQIRSQLAEQISSGALVVGTRLPTVRRLADDLGLATNTVHRAYQELEAAGLVETHGRGGTVVSAGSDQTEQRLLQAAEAFAAVAIQTGADRTHALRIVQAALQPRTVSTPGRQAEMTTLVG